VTPNDPTGPRAAGGETPAVRGAPGFVHATLVFAGLSVIGVVTAAAPLGIVNSALALPALVGTIVALFGVLGARSPTWGSPTWGRRAAAALAWAAVAAVVLCGAVYLGQWVATGAVFLAFVGVAYGLSFRFARNTQFFMVALFAGPMAVYPSLVTAGFTPGDPVPTTGLAAMAAAILAGGATGAVVFPFLAARMPPGEVAVESWGTSVRMAVGVGVLLGAATAIVLSWDRSPTGPWLMVTIVVLARTDPVATLKRSWQRMLGTVAGSLVAVGIGVVATGLFSGTSAYLSILVVGVAFLIVAMGYKLSHPALASGDSYWIYAVLWTPAMVLLATPPEATPVATAEARAGWTLVGAVAITVATILATRVRNPAPTVAG